jgi:hypothetical protein
LFSLITLWHATQANGFQIVQVQSLTFMSPRQHQSKFQAHNGTNITIRRNAFAIHARR